MTPPLDPATLAAPCPCGAGRALAACCARHFEGHPGSLPAPDAELLMRSRYSAFVLDQREHLLATWHPRTRPAVLAAPEPGLRWLGLVVTQHRQLDADHAEVAFVARSKLGGRAHRLQETSRFVREDGRWFYVDGQLR
jgi:SEC-C motif-containing protein